MMTVFTMMKTQALDENLSLWRKLIMKMTIYQRDENLTRR